MGWPIRHYVRTVIRLPLGPDQDLDQRLTPPHDPRRDPAQGAASGSEQWHDTALRTKILLLLIIAGILVLIWFVSSLLLSVVHL